MKFEVGKLYKRTIGSDSILWKCLFVTQRGCPVFVDFQTGTNEIFSYDKVHWEEYREPVKKWFNKYLTKRGVVLCSRIEVFGTITCLSGWDTKIQAESKANPQIGEYLGPVEIEF